MFEMLDRLAEHELKSKLNEIVGDYIDDLLDVLTDPNATAEQKKEASDKMMLLALARIGAVIKL